MPTLANVPDGSDVWYSASHFIDDIITWSSECQELWAANALGFVPTSATAGRVVMCHGDHGNENTIYTDAGIIAIDFDTTTANHAVWDLSWFLMAYAHALNLEQLRSFFRSYLQAWGDPAAPHDVDALFFDARMYEPYILQHEMCPFMLFRAKCDIETVRTKVVNMRILIDAVRAEEPGGPLRSQVLECSLAAMIEKEAWLQLQQIPK